MKRFASSDNGSGSAAMRPLVDDHARVFDRLFHEALGGERLPVLMDSGHTTQFGYRYTSSMTKKDVPVVRGRLKAMFGEEFTDLGSTVGRFDLQQAEVSCKISNLQQRPISVIANFDMDHALNVFFFRFTQGLKGIQIGASARSQMEALERMLALKKEGNVDYYALLSKQSTVAEGFESTG